MIDNARTEELFHRALEIPDPARREFFVREQCPDDATLLKEVQALLANHDQGEALFPSEPAIDPLREPLREATGSMIGRYKLLEQIGEGGFGVVWMAEQEEPVRRRVALKIIKLGMDTRQVIARFEAERQALALMDHPNIAKVLDAGASETGRPYFVMELVRGIPITEFCEQNRLTIKERLQLFIPVCQAIQHAHQKGVIHRDIKPSNVLVTLNDGVPHPMVIDFGVTKAIDQRLTEKTLCTRFAQMIGTPAYMSPEQAEMSKQDVDTRSDVYSLGILLYELLTATTPFPEERLREAGYAEIQRIISQEEPVRPSTLLSRLNGRSRTVAASRSCEPTALMKLIKGDLDWIVLKAIDKDRNRRYETANGLAADVQRYLASEPVAATPPSALYRVRKFIQRNRVVALAGTAVLTSLTLGFLLALGGFVRANRERIIAEGERVRAREESRRARLHQYVADINLAYRSLQDGDLGRARQLLADHSNPGDKEDFRGWEWNYLWGQSRADTAFELGEHPDAIRCVAFSPDGRMLASADMAGTVKTWDIRSRSALQTLQERGYVHELVFLSEKVLVTANQSGTVTLYDANSGRILRTLDVGASVRAVAASPDHLKLACLTGSDGGESLRTWNVTASTPGDDVPTLTPALELAGPEWHSEWYHQGAVLYSPDGTVLAAGYY